MSRPLRIEYSGAWYHVMNRGAGRRAIFCGDDHRVLFLELLRDIVDMFKVEIHGYCLMDNHYHLLIKTPHGNLGRAMRHLNGIYTQRHNRSAKVDGPLFRGRYKGILIDADAYLLNVSRYIHSNPVEAGLVSKAERYAWSSYRAFIGKDTPPRWLTRTDTLNMIGQRNREKRYQVFVDAGIDPVTAAFYHQKKQAPIFGQESFVRCVSDDVEYHPEQPDSRSRPSAATLEDIVRAVAHAFGVDEASIMTSRRGRGQQNPARSAALYLARRIAGQSLGEIAAEFGLGHYGSVSGMISRFDSAVKGDAQLGQKMARIAKIINEHI